MLLGPQIADAWTGEKRKMNTYHVMEIGQQHPIALHQGKALRISLPNEYAMQLAPRRVPGWRCRGREQHRDQKRGRHVDPALPKSGS